MYSLILDADKRILSATYKEFNQNGVIVTTLPDGDITDYQYISKKYVYNPLPTPQPPTPTPTQEERVQALEDAMLVLIGV